STAPPAARGNAVTGGGTGWPTHAPTVSPLSMVVRSAARSTGSWRQPSPGAQVSRVQGLPSSQVPGSHAAAGGGGSVVEVVVEPAIVVVVVLLVVVVEVVLPGPLTSVVESPTVPSTSIISSVSESPSTAMRTKWCTDSAWAVKWLSGPNG